MKIFVCETCDTFIEIGGIMAPDRHVAHRVLAIEGDDYDDLQRLASRHLELARRMRGAGPYSLPGSI